MSNKLTEAIQAARAKISQMDAARNAPDPRAEAQKQLDDLERQAQAEAAQRRETELVEMRQEEQARAAKFEAAVDLAAVEYEKLRDVHREIIARGEGPLLDYPGFPVAINDLQAIRVNRASYADMMERRRAYPKFEMAELEEKLTRERARLEGTKRQANYTPGSVEWEQNLGASRAMEIQLNELRHPGAHAREKAKAEARQAPRTLAEAEAQEAEAEAQRLALVR